MDARVCLACIFLLVSYAAVAGASLCDFVSEGQTTDLKCPSGQVVSRVLNAQFGAFSPGSKCPDAVITQQCPVDLVAPVRLLCLGSAECSVQCSCDAIRDPACSCSNKDGLSSAVPVYPCNGIRKNLTVSVVCDKPLGQDPLPPQPVQKPSGLKLQHLPAPALGIDTLRPMFSWIVPLLHPLDRFRPQDAQTAFQVRVMSNSTGSLVWTSGIVNGSSNPVFRPDGNLPLSSDQSYYWTVTVWQGSPVAPSGSLPRGAAPPALQPNQHPVGGFAAATAYTSDPAHFTTGLLSHSEWAPARWVHAGACTAPAMVEHTALGFGNCSGGLLRKEFDVPAGLDIGRVSIFVGACQYYELYLDGARVGDRQLDVTWTRFNRNRTYATYSLDPSTLTPGKHALGLWVGQGFCGEARAAPNNTGTRQAILRLAAHASNGSQVPVLAVVTDGSWEHGQSPLSYESAYNGEYYIADWEQPGWATTDFKPLPGRAWAPAVPVPGGVPGSPGQPWLQSQMQQPIRAVREMQPLTVRRVLAKPGASAPANPPRWTFDFGQEFSGHVRLALPAGIPAGTNITLSHTEVLGHPPLKQVVNGKSTDVVAQYDGSAYTGNLFWARPIDVYQTGLAGESAPASYETRFSFHGFRYVELSASPPLPAAIAAQINRSTLLGINVRTDAAEQSDVRIAHPTLQRIYNNSWWTEASGLMGIPSGAAGRGERGGWTGDAAIASEQEFFDFDTGALFSQYLEQIHDVACWSDGTIPHSIPMSDPDRDGMSDWNDPSTCSGASMDPSWNTVFPTILWNAWRYTNDTGAVAQHYDLLLQYMGTLQASVKASGMAHIYCLWGDHQSLAHTPCEVTASASFIRDLRYAAELSAALGKTAEEQAFQLAARDALAEFTSTFWHASNGTCSVGSQTAQAIALWLGAVPESTRGSVADSLAADLLQNGVTVGFLGASYIFEALVWSNRTGAAVQALLRTKYPGYGYQVFNAFEPSTSLWESWNGDTTRQWVAESSRSHHYQTNIASFLRKHVVGLDMPRCLKSAEAEGACSDPTSAGWAVVEVKPEAALSTGKQQNVLGARVTLASSRGSVMAYWERGNGTSGAAASGAVSVRVTIPPTSTGVVYVPRPEAGSGIPDDMVVTDMGNIIWSHGAFQPGASPGVLSAEAEGDFVKVRTLSGFYSFETRL